jgi:60 kDa SS-A/Ro ribonucleoprotein
MNYRSFYQTRQTPQSQPIPDKPMVANSAGGYSFAVDDWKRLDRFLVLGSEGGTYYINARKLTRENAQAVHRCIQTDGCRTVARIVEISEAGRAPKNDPALFALAMCAGLGNDSTRQAALAALPQVARIGTHLFHFMEYVEGFRGWGRGLRRAVANWYAHQNPDGLAYQAIKYQQRDGWGHRDALRLSHPKTESLNPIFKWITKGEISDNTPGLILAFEAAQRAETEKVVIDLITTRGLPWEAIPPQWLASPDIWKALLPRLPMTALLRNLGRMTANGAIKPLSQEAGIITERLANQEAIKAARIHPLSVLVALKIYEQGHGEKGNLSWSPIRQIVDALDTAYYLSFGNVESTGKRMMLALDVSGSMSWGKIASMPITPRVGSAAMAMVTARTEANYIVTAFSHQMVPVSISPRQRLDDVVKILENISMGGTDCAQPMLYALMSRIQIDAFVVYTDSETWFGKTHPVQALEMYRQKLGIPAKLIVVGMTSNGFTVADPNDAGMLDCVGFDLSTPQVISDFVKDA